MGRNIPSPGSRWACLTCLSWFIKTWKHIERIVKILPPCMCLFVQYNLMFSFLLCVCTYWTWLLLVIDGYNPLQWMAPRYHDHFMFEAGQVYPAEPAGLKHHLVHGMSVDGQNIKHVDFGHHSISYWFGYVLTVSLNMQKFVILCPSNVFIFRSVSTPPP